MSQPHLTDLFDLDSNERLILLTIFRHGNLTHEALLKAVKKSKAGKANEIESALASLIERGWLRRTGEEDEPLYQLQFARRSLHGLGEANLKHKLGIYSVVSTHDLLDIVEETTKPAEAAHPQAKQILFYMLALAIINSLVLGLLDVVAISGFVKTLNTQNLPWLWVIEMLAGLLFSGFYLQSIDRIARTRLIHLLLGGLAALYLIFGGMFLLGVSTAITFPLLYLIYSQQVIIFPIAFWNLANDLYSLVEARRIFPRLASGEMIGRLIGYAIFSLPGLLGLKQMEAALANGQIELLFFSAGLFVLGLTYSLLLFRDKPITQAHAEQPVKSLRQSLEEAAETIREVPLFRYLTLSSALEWIALIILWYLFYQSLDQGAAQAGGFALGYSLFNIGYLIIPLLMQWRLTGYLLKIVAPRDVPLGLPLVLLVSVLLGLIFQNGFGTVSAIFLPMVVYNAWDLPALQAVQNLVPEERRGRVRALLNNYSYALGVIVGSVVLGIMILIDAAFGYPNNGWFRLFALMLALFAALGAVTSALWARATYEESLLSWRLTRRQRKSDVLEKLEF